MKERLSRLEARAVKKQELALEAMSQAGLRKIEQSDLPLRHAMALPRSWSLQMNRFPKAIGASTA
jgi:hypothetical protein